MFCTYTTLSATSASTIGNLCSTGRLHLQQSKVSRYLNIGHWDIESTTSSQVPHKQIILSDENSPTNQSIRSAMAKHHHLHMPQLAGNTISVLHSGNATPHIFRFMTNRHADNYHMHHSKRIQQPFQPTNQHRKTTNHNTISNNIAASQTLQHSVPEFELISS